MPKASRVNTFYYVLFFSVNQMNGYEYSRIFIKYFFDDRHHLIQRKITSSASNRWHGDRCKLPAQIIRHIQSQISQLDQSSLDQINITVSPPVILGG